MSFTNIHGLCPKGASMRDSTNDLVASHQRYDISICGISEHHIPMKALPMSQRLYTSMKSSIGGQHVTYQFDSSPEIPINGSTRLMGGSGILALGHVIGRLEPNGKSGDSMGRWSSLTPPSSSLNDNISISSMPLAHQQDRAYSMASTTTSSRHLGKEPTPL